KVARDITARLQNDADRAELHRRLATLVTASSSLLTSPETQSVTNATIALAQQLLVADGYAVWAHDQDRAEWRVVSARGVSDGFAGRVLPSNTDGRDGSPLSFLEPLPVSDVVTHPMLKAVTDAYRSEGIQSMLVCPMRLGA